jgi:hypothetical protein
MAHPVYRLKNEQRVPSVTTIIGRFKEAGGLIHWAWQLGKEGKDYREVRDSAAEAGTMAHAAVEAFIRGHDYSFPDSDVGRKASVAFGAFKEWANQTHLKATHTEVSMVSEAYRFGGTMDALLISGLRSVGDWKSSNALYPEYLVQVAAYGKLWEENRPDEPITGGYHLLRFDKTHGDFTHKWWGELETAWQAFLRLRDLYEFDKELKQRIK